MLFRCIVIFLNVLVAASILIDGWKLPYRTPKQGGIYWIRRTKWEDGSTSLDPCIAIHRLSSKDFLVAIMGRHPPEPAQDSVPAEHYFKPYSRVFTPEGYEVEIDQYHILKQGHIVHVSPQVMHKSHEGQPLTVLDDKMAELTSVIINPWAQKSLTTTNHGPGAQKLLNQADGRRVKTDSYQPDDRNVHDGRGPDSYRPDDRNVRDGRGQGDSYRPDDRNVRDGRGQRNRPDDRNARDGQRYRPYR